MKSIIEINKKNAMAGRTPAKFILHRIYNDATEYNANGISWNRKYTEDCKESVKGMPLVCQFADSENKIPFGAHGELSSKDGKIVFEDSLVVGSFEDAYIDDAIEINGEKFCGLVGSAYIYNQRFPELVDYLQEKYNNGESVESSVEICADKSKGNSKIVYDGGWKETGRVPQHYQYSGQALCIGVDPADNSALMIELNSANKLKIKDGDNLAKQKIHNVEINELSYDDISILITRAFNRVMSKIENYSYCDYGIYKLYPISGRVVFYEWYTTPSIYYMTTYSIQNNTVTIGEITKVEEDWKPINDEAAVEINISLIKEMLGKTKNKEGKPIMDEKIIELNQTIADKTVEINSLTTKNTELSEAITNANKTVEELNAKIDSMTVELNSANEELNVFKAEKAEAELNAKKSEVKTYFDVEIPKNKFSEEEVNSLKHFVEEVDLAGLKNAESEICTKKFKEMMAIEKQDNKETEEEVETNSTTTYNFIAFHEKEKKVVKDEFPTFFKE